MINFNQLRAFYEVARSQKILEASRKLCVTQPAISAQIKSFEEFCGLSLFKRNGRRVMLTESGRFLLQRCHQLFDQEKRIEDSIRDLHALKSGVLKVGTSKTCSRYLMPRYINKFHSLYPEVRFILDEGTSREMGRSLLRGENEMAIIAKTEDLSAVKLDLLFEERITLFASSHHPFARKAGIRFEELEGQSIIMKDTGSGTQKIVREAFSRRGMIPRTLLEVTDIDCIKKIVERGEGISFLVHFALREDLKKRVFKAIPILDEALSIQVYIAYLKDQPLSPAANAFLKVLAMSVRK